MCSKEEPWCEEERDILVLSIRRHGFASSQCWSEHQHSLLAPSSLSRDSSTDPLLINLRRLSFQREIAAIQSYAVTLLHDAMKDARNDPAEADVEACLGASGNDEDDRRFDNELHKRAFEPITLTESLVAEENFLRKCLLTSVDRESDTLQKAYERRRLAHCLRVVQREEACRRCPDLEVVALPCVPNAAQLPQIVSPSFKMRRMLSIFNAVMRDIPLDQRKTLLQSVADTLCAEVEAASIAHLVPCTQLLCPLLVPPSTVEDDQMQSAIDAKR